MIEIYFLKGMISINYSEKNIRSGVIQWIPEKSRGVIPHSPSKNSATPLLQIDFIKKDSSEFSEEVEDR